MELGYDSVVVVVVKTLFDCHNIAVVAVVAAELADLDERSAVAIDDRFGHIAECSRQVVQHD